jgi:hypothetical protein
MRIPLIARSLRRRALAAFAAGAFVTLGSGPAQADVPACFVAPPDASLAVATAPGPAPIACTLLAKVLLASEETQLAWLPGAVLNKTLGLSTDAFPDSAYAVRFVVTPQFNAAFSGTDALVRFASNDFSAQVGSWWTVLETVSDRSGRLEDKAAIAAELALPASSVPSIEASASEVRVGTLGYFGLVAPAFGEPGGGVQFWFPGEPVYSSVKALP